MYAPRMTSDPAAMNTVPIRRAVASRFLLLVAVCFFPAAGMAQQVPAAQQVPSDIRSVNELLAAARQAARADRNREAADLFARAIDRAPQRRSELLREYADQLTYARQAGAAVPLYRELIAAEKSPEERLHILGGLGLLLGSAGLGVVVARNVLERRREFGLLEAVGFTRAQLRGLVFAEHRWLILGALIIGAVSALVGVWPNASARSSAFPWRESLFLLGAMTLLGGFWTWFATRIALRRSHLAALRNE